MLRAPVGIIYQTMHTAADIADESACNAARPPARLADYDVFRERAVLDVFDRCVAAARSIEGNAQWWRSCSFLHVFPC
ncbi:hypothetical protein [Paraburkholderia sprentiae]|uniref:hypothetical protein n=1 Tax=Paraburkholderia sprentiae TaxID=948107 RepID=UPI00040FEF10|nr:hypothetical protein [Paraburkholderia sprentiae]